MSYDNGWTVQDFLNSAAGAFPDQPSGQKWDPSMLNQQTTMGWTPQERLSQLGIQDPMNNLGAQVPDEIPGNMFQDSIGGLSVLALPLLAAGGAGALGGLGEAGVAGGIEAGMGIPELGLIANPATAEAAIAGGIPASMLSGGGFSLPSAPPGTSTIAQQLAKALGGSSGGEAASRGIQGFMQGGSPASQGYVRKARPGLEQPAFLGEQQQALGSAEDDAFNKMVSGHGEDVSTRARQMAAQLRGRPGMFAFKG